MPDTHRLTAGKKTRISEFSTRGRDFHDDRESAEAEFVALRDELIELQNRLYAEGRRKLLIVLQAMDAGGKDSTIRKVFRGVNPQGVRVTSFKAPSAEELAHDYLWRIHKAVPAVGMIGVFNRSHYEEVLVACVEELVPKEIWKRRFEQLNQFEKLLHESGTTILKFYLHISKDEQKKRFQERIDIPEKNWKFSQQDIIKRKHWDVYMEAFEDVLNKCTTEWAPWYVIPADQKWYRNLAISRVIVDTLKRMNLQYPQPKVDVSKIVIE